MGFMTANNQIKCNGNLFAPATDDLVKECIEVAKKNGLTDFVIKINGHTYNDATELPTNSIAALAKQAEVVGVDEPVAEVKTAQDVAA